jgi:hypothetical protein
MLVLSRSPSRRETSAADYKRTLDFRKSGSCCGSELVDRKDLAAARQVLALIGGESATETCPGKLIQRFRSLQRAAIHKDQAFRKLREPDGKLFFASALALPNKYSSL